MSATPALRDRMDASRTAQASGQGETLYGLLEKSKPQIGRALQSTGKVSVDRFTRIVLTEARRTPRLLECDPRSVLGAVLLSAQLGIEPGPLEQAYLIPRRNRRAGTVECQFMIGYRGYLELARRSGELLTIDAQVVYENDEFEETHGLQPVLRHRPARTDRGKPIAAYAVALLKNGGHSFVVLSVDEIEQRRKRSAAGNDGPWSTDWAAMARKSAIRALAPYLPQTPEFAKAQQVDEVVRTDVTEDLDDFAPPALDAGTDVDDPSPDGVDEPPGDAATPSRSPGDGGEGDGESGSEAVDGPMAPGSPSPPKPDAAPRKAPGARKQT